MCRKLLSSRGRDAVGLPPISRFQRTDPSALLQPGDGSIERSRSQANVRETMNVFHHGVAMLVAVRQARKNEKDWI